MLELVLDFKRLLCDHLISARKYLYYLMYLLAEIYKIGCLTALQIAVGQPISFNNSG